MPLPVLALRHVPYETLGTLSNHLTRAGLEFRYWDLGESGGAANSSQRFDPANWSALVVLGGPMNVDDTRRHPFLTDEVLWIRQSLRARLPILGICLGSQLLAKALGARVYANGVKEIGWYSLQITEQGQQDPLFRGSAPIETVFQWHGDTFDLPEGSVLLASSEQCKNQAFRHGANAYGLQFHLEMTPEMIDQWLAEPACSGELAELEYIHPQAILAQTPAQFAAMRPLADRVLNRFVELCQSRVGPS